MKRTFLIRLLIPVIFSLFAYYRGSSQAVNSGDLCQLYFDEIKKACNDHIGLWGGDLYGPVLLVDPATRHIFANEADSLKILHKEGILYAGILPQEINPANTALQWSGKRWAMILAPLPDNLHERLNLASHELFHRIQPRLNFHFSGANNDHLARKDGRIYLRLELEALKKALNSENRNDMMRCLTDALTFREYRYRLFPGAAENENKLELNEGIAEFTGVMMSGRSDQQIRQHFKNRIDVFQSSDSYVRSFPYETIPVYGYLLSLIQKNWNKKIDNMTDLTDFFIDHFTISIPGDIAHYVDSVGDVYNGSKISAEENNREKEIGKKATKYKDKFISRPHFTIGLENMNFSFDPSSVFPVEGYGTYYPSVRISDKWGILDVSKGILISSDFSKVFISPPVNVSGDTITGNGWLLRLKKGYSLEMDKDGRNYFLKPE